MNERPATSGRNFWPAGVIGALALFIAGTVTLVVLSARNDVELVRADYYEQELRFQEQITRRERTQALSEPVRIAYDAAQRRLTLALPAAHAAAQAQGEIQLYRPSAAGLDRRVPLQLDAQGRQTLDTATLRDGLWRVRVTWRAGGEDFTFDEKVIVGGPKST